LKHVGIVLSLFVFNIFVLFGASGQASQECPLVLACLQSTYSFASILTKGTSIKVSNLGPAGYPMGRLGQYFKKHEKEVKDYAARADAVITIRSVWKHDPLYILTLPSQVFPFLKFRIAALFCRVHKQVNLSVNIIKLSLPTSGSASQMPQKCSASWPEI